MLIIIKKVCYLGFCGLCTPDCTVNLGDENRRYLYFLQGVSKERTFKIFLKRLGHILKTVFEF